MRTLCCDLTRVDPDAVGCRVVTEPLTWADGPNLDIVQNTDSDALCFAACQASSACNVSIRDPVSRSCFLKAAGPADLLQSLSLSSSYCAPGPQRSPLARSTGLTPPQPGPPSILAAPTACAI